MNAHNDIETLKAQLIAELAAYGDARYSWWFARKNKNYFNFINFPYYDTLDFQYLVTLADEIKQKDELWDKQPWYQYWYFRLSSPYQHRLLQKQRALLCYSCATLYSSEINNDQSINQTALAAIIQYHAPKLSFFSRIKSTIMQFSNYFSNLPIIKSNPMNNRNNTKQPRKNQDTFSITQALSCNDNPESYVVPTQQRIIKRKVWDQRAIDQLKKYYINFDDVCTTLLSRIHNIDIITHTDEAKRLVNEIKETLVYYRNYYLQNYDHHEWDLQKFTEADYVTDWVIMTNNYFSHLCHKTEGQIDSKYNAWLAIHNHSPRIDNIVDEPYRHESPSETPSSNTTPDSSASETEFETNPASAENAAYTAERRDTALTVENNETEEVVQISFVEQGQRDLQSFKNKIEDWQLRLFKDFRNDQESVETEMKAEYKKLCLKYHPDKNSNNREAAEVIFKDIQNSWDDLKKAMASPETLAAKVNGGFTKPEQAELWREMRAFSRRMDEDNKKMRVDLDRLEKEMAENGRQLDQLAADAKEARQVTTQLTADVEELKRDSRNNAEKIETLKRSFSEIGAQDKEFRRHNLQLNEQIENLQRESRKNGEIIDDLEHNYKEISTDYKTACLEARKNAARLDKIQRDFSKNKADSVFIEKRIAQLEREQRNDLKIDNQNLNSYSVPNNSNSTTQDPLAVLASTFKTAK